MAGDRVDTHSVAGTRRSAEVSRESKRERDRLERRAAQSGDAGDAGDGAPPEEPPATGGSGAPGGRKREGRTGPGQFVREVRSELNRVHWPNRKQLTQYSLAVLVTVIIMTAYIFTIDQGFGQLVLWMFG